MAIDLNQDMGALIKSLMGKNNGSSDSGAAASANASNEGSVADKIIPFRNVIIIFIIIIGSSVAYYKLHYTKMVKTNAEKAEEIERLNKLKTDTANLEKQITNMRNDLSASKEEYLESLSHFGNSEDLGELYQSISILAEKYGLKVLNIKETTPPPPPAEPLNSKGTKPAFQKKANITEVKEIQVKVELKGPYVEYIRFKEDLAVAEMLLKINEETVKVKKDEVGKVYSQLTLTTYAIDKKPFQKVIATDDNGDK
ncbi:MAG: hypothetical protein PQ612_04640 [Rickettsiales bacterium]|nr:hypothetical protein [Pseudomonadota bacterium]MDA0966099.1 hypothetical protein [Pseudomonadota bacterium]MDG4543236.1 hypothetical protein [Rickettsiales bacterium]MDG4545434.1 hypothetical protein [Rickettsiales bacterium]MDG4547883.1 hypothetical protein [Rickettsiales bacterium]